MDLRRLLPAASAPVLALALSACGATWTPVDGGDGDGVSIAEGDCDESPTTGASIGPDQAEIHYDGVDQNCNGNDDENDKDGDGIASTEFGGTDCWDDPDIVPDAFVALNGLPQLAAADVYPGAAADTFYDGIDQDCAGDSDFDKDGDGFDAGRWPQRDGSLGSDCWDADDEDAPSVATCGADGTAGLLTAADVNPEATESSPLDGIDQDCSADLSIVEFDVDGDSFPFCEECDDANAMIYPNPAIPEVWYNGIDENCDLNDGDQDGDGYVDAAYTEPGAAFYRVDPANASASALDPDGDGTDNFQAGDCWDTPESRPTVYTAINGLPQPAAAEVNPGVQEDTPYDDVDQDCAGDSDFDADGDGQDTRDYLTRAFAQGPDCDDSDAIVFEGSLAEMWYDGVDTDCEGNDDYDQDRDRHVPDAYVGLVTTYAAGTGSLPGGDCDDQNDHANPAEPNELCATDFDDDCDGSTNDVNAEGAQRFYADADRDGYGDPAESRLTCIAEDIYDVPYFATEELYTDTVPVPDAVDTDPVSNRAWDVGEPYVDANGNGRIDLFDCDDTGPVAADRFPGNPEVVGDGIDQDCNIARDEDTSGTLDPSEQANVDDCFVDRDNDGFGTAVVRRGLSLDCTEDDRLAKVDGDCRDVGTNARYAYPGAAPQDSAVDCMMDRDGDLWGDRVAPVSFLETGFEAVEGTDCDDADAGDFPGATEIAANGDDEDCDVSRNTADTNGDGLPDGTDLCFVDTDNDGFGTNATVAGSTLDCTADLGVASARWIGAEAYVDANGNHRWDDGEPYTDADGSGAYEFGEPFEDLDFNGERNPAEDFTDTDANGTWTFGTPVVDCLDRTSVHPDAARTFPGAAEAEDAVACKMDADGDGFGDDDLGKPSRDTAAATGALARLTLTPGTTLVAGTDCDDSSAQDKPQAATAELVGNL
ncbi:MAG: hypothetical protein RLZZ299_42, partial [Pseudomonadota bacterium]